MRGVFYTTHSYTHHPVSFSRKPLQKVLHRLAFGKYGQRIVEPPILAWLQTGPVPRWYPDGFTICPNGEQTSFQRSIHKTMDATHTHTYTLAHSDRQRGGSNGPLLIVCFCFLFVPLHHSIKLQSMAALVSPWQNNTINKKMKGH